jgi:hypothetical protein
MKSARITPLLGLAFLISAITAAWPLAIFARSALEVARERGSRRPGGWWPGTDALRGGHFFVLDGDDFVQDVTHGDLPCRPRRAAVSES